MLTILLLILSNVFMTVAWYGHLKFKSTPLVIAVLASWFVALPEYALQVPANRLGHGRFTAPQLKIIQEIVSLSVFCVFSVMYLRERPTWRESTAMILIVIAVALAMSRPRPRTAHTGPSPGATPAHAIEPDADPKRPSQAA